MSEKNVEVGDTDISFDCPHCGMNHVVDFRAAGLQVNCKECGKSILVPIPAGMELGDLDMDSGEILQQLFASRRNYQKAEIEIQELKSRLTKIQEALGVIQAVIEEGLAIQQA